MYMYASMAGRVYLREQYIIIWCFVVDDFTVTAIIQPIIWFMSLPVGWPSLDMSLFSRRSVFSQFGIEKTQLSIL